MILVDSSVWIAYFNGIQTWQTDLLDNYISNVPVVMGDLILAEVLQAEVSPLLKPFRFGCAIPCDYC